MFMLIFLPVLIACTFHFIFTSFRMTPRGGGHDQNIMILTLSEYDQNKISLTLANSPWSLTWSSNCWGTFAMKYSAVYQLL